MVVNSMEKGTSITVTFNSDEVVQIHNALYSYVVKELKEKDILLSNQYTNLFRRWDSILNLIGYGKVTMSNIIDRINQNNINKQNGITSE